MNRAEKRRQKKLAGKNAKFGRGSTGRPELSIEQSLHVATQHHSANRLSQAKSIYQGILQANPDHPVTLHLLGVIAHQTGSDNVAVDLITRALTIKPDYLDAHSNLGNVLKALGKLDAAVASFHKALAIEPDASAYNNLGITYGELGQNEEAIAAYGKAIEIKPDFAQAHNNLGNALQRMGKTNAAVASFRTAIAIEPGYAETYNSLGTALQLLDKTEDAIICYSQALEINPDYAEAHYNIGNAFTDQGKLDQAVASFHKTLSLQPDFAVALSSLGSAYTELERPDDAIDCFYRALAIQPGLVDAHSNLAEALEKTNRIQELREALSEANEHCPNHPLLSISEAQLLKHDGEFTAARERLESTGMEIPDARFLSQRAYLLGELCDRLGDTDTAYDYFVEGNEQCNKTSRAMEIDSNHYRQRVKVLAKRFTSDWVGGWRDQSRTEDRRDPVFLVGFPRSGTTLLDTILLSHSAISIVEEMPTIQYVGEALNELPGGYPGGMANLDPAQLDRLRQIYFKELDKHLAPADRSLLVIDKNPMNLVDAGLIHKIFPKVLFLFAERHPCDCVLSCFMQNFLPNEATVNFLNLEDTAHFYDRAMNLWWQYQQILPLQVHTVRYENLVEAFQETVAPMLEFLGLAWEESVRDHAKTAGQRGKIKTASYSQVTQPLYTRARGRWHRYRQHMAPALPTLLPWIKHFGYDE